MSTSKKTKFLITAALPYANGPLHFGHLAGVFIPSDIYSRHRKIQGHTVKFICGSDEHGVAIMLSAEKAKMPYREYVDKWHLSHKNLFQALDIKFDFFGRTSESYHEVETLEWFHELNKKGYIEKQSEKQLYCIDDKKFLPDRFVEGTCYKCKYPNARGDECPNCGEWIDPIRLIEPVSKISGSKNIEIRETENYFLSLTKLEPIFRKAYAEHEHWRKLVKGFVQGMLDQGLQDRCITRDLDWGIKVPLPEAIGKRLYVWFDAPIGYVSNLKQLLKESGSSDDYRKDWFQAKDVEISHFIGKDNIVFHAIIFPMMALGTGFMKMVDEIPANEFLNLEGKQFSKSAGWYIDAETALEAFGIDAIRYYLCSVIPETGDTNFSWDTFETTYNDFRNKIGNFVHRSLSFIHKSFPEGLPSSAFIKAAETKETQAILLQVKKIISDVDQFSFVKALNEILLLGQHANEYFQAAAPWKQMKEDKSAAEISLAQAVLYIGAMATVLEPFVPSVAKRLKNNFTDISEEDFKKFYCGDQDYFLQIFSAKGFCLRSAPEVLLPQIMPELIAEWKEKLR